MEKLLSVIIPVYNVEKYIRRTVDSILNQTYTNIELILVDDGSTDNSLDVCLSYKKDPRVQVFTKENGGQSTARNLGLDNCSGDYIAFMDSDDYIESTMYEKLIKLLEDTNSDITSCAVQRFYEDDERILETYSNEVVFLDKSKVLHELTLNRFYRFEVWNKVFKKEVLENIRFNEGQLFEEIAFTRHYLKNINRIANIDTPLHNYLVSRPGNTNSKFNIKKLDAFKEFDLFINDEFYNEEDKEMLKALKIQFTIILGLQAKNFSNKEAFKKARKEFKFMYKSEKNNKYVNKKAIKLYKFSPTLYNIILKFK